MNILLSFILCFVIFAVQIDDTIQQEEWFEATFENVISSDFQLTEKCRSLTECLVLCKGQHYCYGVSFNRKTSNCTFYAACPKNSSGTFYVEDGSTIYCPRETCLQTTKSADCKGYKDSGCNDDGIYDLYPYGTGDNTTIRAYCDMTTDGGGWTVFHKRFSGIKNFYRPWEAYKSGFGDVSTEYWLGNKWIHEMTLKSSELYIKVKGFDGPVKFAKYSSFSVGNESTDFMLFVANYSGTAGDSLSGDTDQNVVHAYQRFSTKDMDNDQSTASCAQKYKGGWWYKSCHMSNLNGEYCGYPIVVDDYCNSWSKYGNRNEGLEESTMMIRRH